VLSPYHVTKSNNIATFALDLKSAYEREHTILGLLSLANFSQNDVLQFHAFNENNKISFFMAE
jgi:hypothetical protein